MKFFHWIATDCHGCDPVRWQLFRGVPLSQSSQKTTYWWKNTQTPVSPDLLFSSESRKIILMPLPTPTSGKYSTVIRILPNSLRHAKKSNFSAATRLEYIMFTISIETSLQKESICDRCHDLGSRHWISLILRFEFLLAKNTYFCSKWTPLS